MKKYVFAAALIVIILIAGYIVNDKINNGALTSISAGNVIKITITVDGGDKLLRTTEDRSVINDIVNHINGLHLKRTHKNVEDYTGTAFVIKVYFSDDSMKEYVEYSNLFFKESGKEWYRIPYEEADKFGSIYNNMDK